MTVIRATLVSREGLCVHLCGRSPQPFSQDFPPVLCSACVVSFSGCDHGDQAPASPRPPPVVSHMPSGLVFSPEKSSQKSALRAEEGPPWGASAFILLSIMEKRDHNDLGERSEEVTETDEVVTGLGKSVRVPIAIDSHAGKLRAPSHCHP